ncbi:MAG: putative GrpE protein, mitochondrial [Pseudomonadota bacterium]|jgi:molecular chaperone GrpE
MSEEIKQEEMQNANDSLESGKDNSSNEIENLKKENQELKEKFLRLAAEIENTKRRLNKEVEDANKFAVSSFAKSMIEINDILETALSHVPEESIKENKAFEDLFHGLKMSVTEMKIKFEKFGIEQINPVNQKFDHNLHEAVSRIPHEAEIGTVVNVLRNGYSINGRLLRAAMVIVSMGKVD